MVQREALDGRVRERPDQGVALGRHLRAFEEELLQRDHGVPGGEAVDRVGKEGEGSWLAHGVDREVAELAHSGGDVLAQIAQAAGVGPEEKRLEIGRESSEVDLVRGGEGAGKYEAVSSA